MGARQKKRERERRNTYSTRTINFRWIQSQHDQNVFLYERDNRQRKEKKSLGTFDATAGFRQVCPPAVKLHVTWMVSAAQPRFGSIQKVPERSEGEEEGGGGREEKSAADAEVLSLCARQEIAEGLKGTPHRRSSFARSCKGPGRSVRGCLGSPAGSSDSGSTC